MSTPIAPSFPSPSEVKASHPPALYMLFGTEMWERFSFYTMSAMLALYLQDKTDGFGWTKSQASTMLANYLMFVYASPLIGGWLADRILGYRRSISIGGLFFVAGHTLLAVQRPWALYLALTFLVIGNGFFKPNISSMVGNLYPVGSRLRDSAYNIFYMGINLGALAAPLVAEGVRQRYGFHPAFVVAGVGMAIGMIIFWACYGRLAAADREVGLSTPPNSDTTDLPDIPAPRSAIDDVPEWTRIGSLFVIFAIVIVFWMVFHQNATTLTYWANDNTDWASSKFFPFLIRTITFGHVDGEKVSGVISNSINPFWIVVLAYPLTRVWAWLGRRGLEPSTPTKMALGMTFTGFAFLILFVAGRLGGDTGRVSPWWLVSAYAVLSLGELMLSPMGLSLVSKVAPARLRAQLMGCWFLATAIGNKLTQISVFWERWSHSSFWLTLSLLAFAMAVLLFLLLRPLNRAMPGV